ncbi:ferredoxin [Saccharothrix syringae]|uniref:ferredoxin n=1 Tax=Saccharothrix syringae TaxID=103733 RepID=UPI000526345A|nr:ferredoxin [Saccharothrix syringae]
MSTAEATWRVAVDRQACIGTGVCAGSAPEQIEIRDGKAAALRPEVGPSDALLDAAEMCPMAAITVTDVATGRVLAPEE